MATLSLPMALARVVVVLGLLWVVLRLLPRFVGQRAGSGSRNRSRSRNKQTERTIEILDRQTLTKTASVFVLRIGSTVHAVGVTEQHVDRLVEISDECVIDLRDEVLDTDVASRPVAPSQAPRSDRGQALDIARSLLAATEPTPTPFDLVRQRTAILRPPRDH
jgi:flagellar biogenesis protein FliO